MFVVVVVCLLGVVSEWLAFRLFLAGCFGCFWGALVVLRFVFVVFFCYLVGGWLCCNLGVFIVFGGIFLLLLESFYFVLAWLLVLDDPLL